MSKRTKSARQPSSNNVPIPISASSRIEKIKKRHIKEMTGGVDQTDAARLSGLGNVNNKTLNNARLRKFLELDAKILPLLKSGKNAPDIGRILGVNKLTVYHHMDHLLDTGQIDQSSLNYTKIPELEHRKWYKIMERVGQELPFYQKQVLVPTARKMGYRLLELTATQRDKNRNITTQELTELGLPDCGPVNHPDFHKVYLFG